jgi:hypothetical protein
MLRYREWLLLRKGRAGVPKGVLAAYEAAFKDQLRHVIQRTQNPALREKLIEMLDCPVRDSRGQCRSFSDYIVSALIKNGIHHRYDMEQALHYVVEKMLMPVDDAGQPRTTVFGGFEERPDQTPDFNPLQARFLRDLQFAVNNIHKGKFVRLATTERRPAGTASIGVGRTKDGDPNGGISPDEIAARPSTEGDLAEMVADIEGLLRRKEPEAGFPLVDLFRAIVAGMTSAEQRARFGDRRTRAARQVIVDTIHDYAQVTGDAALLHLLARMRDGGASDQSRVQVRQARPVLSDKERDYSSICSVIARYDRPVGSAEAARPS